MWKFRWSWYAAVVGGFLGVDGSLRAEEPVGESQPPARPPIEEQVESLDQKIRSLERSLELEREAEQAKSKDAPVIGVGAEGFFLKSQSGSFQLKIRGYLQADARFFFDDDSPELTDTFLLRRARPIIEGTVFNIFDFRLMPDFGGGSATIQDGYLDVRLLPELKIRAGKFKPPLGLERLQSATDIKFIERGLTINLVPNRDIGGMIHGDLFGSLLTYGVGAFNGLPDGGSGDVDNNDAKDVVARVFLQPFAASDESLLKGLGAGLAGSLGAQKTTLPTYRTTGQNVFFNYLATSVSSGTRYRVAPQAYYYAGPLGILGEYVLSAQEVRNGATEETLGNYAWQVAVSYVLTGEAASYKSVVPKKPFDLSAGTLGALEVVARYSDLMVDEDAFPVFANPAVAARRAQGIGVGLNWYLNKAFKVALDYERTKFRGGAVSGNREPENAVLLRFQIAF